MKNLNLLNLLLVVASFSASFLYFSYLPDQVPMHWNITGKIDSYMPKSLAAFVMPGLTLLVFVVYQILPYLDPKKNNYKHFNKEWQTIQTAIVGFLTYMQFLVFYISTHPDTSLLPFMFVGLGTLFIIVGNNLSKIKQNYFIGIRVPWTLASEENWNKTHRFARSCFIASGVIILIEALFIWQAAVVVFGSIILAVILPSVYSLLLFKKIVS